MRGRKGDQKYQKICDVIYGGPKSGVQKTSGPADPDLNILLHVYTNYALSKAAMGPQGPWVP